MSHFQCFDFRIFPRDNKDFTIADDNFRMQCIVNKAEFIDKPVNNEQFWNIELITSDEFHEGNLIAYVYDACSLSGPMREHNCGKCLFWFSDKKFQLKQFASRINDFIRIRVFYTFSSEEPTVYLEDSTTEC